MRSVSGFCFTVDCLKRVFALVDQSTCHSLIVVCRILNKRRLNDLKLCQISALQDLGLGFGIFLEPVHDKVCNFACHIIDGLKPGRVRADHVFHTGLLKLAK